MSIKKRFLFSSLVAITAVAWSSAWAENAACGGTDNAGSDGSLSTGYSYSISTADNEAPALSKLLEQQEGADVYAECIIGEQKYDTFAEAIAAVVAGDTLKLIADVADDVAVTMPGTKFTIDLNGRSYSNTHTFTVTDSLAVIDGKEGCTTTFSVAALALADSATLTAADVVIPAEGCWAMDHTSRISFSRSWANGGTLTVDMEGATQKLYKLVSYTGAEAKTLGDYGNVTLLNNNDTTYCLKVIANELYAATRDVITDSDKKNGNVITSEYSEAQFKNGITAIGLIAPGNLKLQKDDNKNLWVVGDIVGTPFSTLDIINSNTDQSAAKGELVVDGAISGFEWITINNAAEQRIIIKDQVGATGDITISNCGHLEAQAQAGGSMAISNSSANTLIGDYTGAMVSVTNNADAAVVDATLTATAGDVTVEGQTGSSFSGTTAISAIGAVNLKGVNTFKDGTLTITAGTDFVINDKVTLNLEKDAELCMAGTLKQINSMGILNLKGGRLADDVTIANNGILSWDITDSIASVLKWSQLVNNDSLFIATNDAQPADTTYILAKNAALAAGSKFYVTGIEGEMDSLTVGGASVAYGQRRYALAVDNSENLTLKIESTYPYGRKLSKAGNYGTICLGFKIIATTGVDGLYVPLWKDTKRDFVYCKEVLPEETEAGCAYIFKAEEEADSVTFAMSGKGVDTPVIKNNMMGWLDADTIVSEAFVKEHADYYMLVNYRFISPATGSTLKQNCAMADVAGLPGSQPDLAPGHRIIAFAGGSATDVTELMMDPANVQQTVKMLIDGQLVIIRAGKKYNAQGFQLNE